jgi:hypothetical protein
MRKIFRTACLTIVVLFGFVALTCDEDCPVCPKEPEPAPEGNYRLYTYDSYKNILFSFDIPADTIVDSVTPDYGRIEIPFDLDITPDGNRLLLSDYYAANTKILRASNLTVEQTIQRIGQYIFDPKGNYLLCSAAGLTFLDPVTFAPLDSLPLGIRQDFLDTVNNWFFGADRDSMWFYRVDCLSHSLIDTIKIRLPGGGTVGIHEFAYNWLTNDLYFHAKTIGAAYFLQYSLDSDSLVSSTWIRGPFGGVAISPDGKSVYMVDGGNAGWGIIPDGYVWIFDAITREVRDLIAPYVYPDGLLRGAAFGSIVPTPDSRRLYIGMNTNGFSLLPIVEVDLLEKKMSNAFPYYDGVFYKLSIGMIPNE